MIRGTTPLLSFTVPFDPAETKRICITFSQNNREVFTLEKRDCTFEGNTISTTLSQDHTLSLKANATVQIQIRVTFPSENSEMDSALASEIITTTVQRILKDGEI